MGMRGMVCGHHIDPSITNGFEKGLPVRSAFNGRIPFDAITETLVIAFVKPQMMNTSLCGDGTEFTEPNRSPPYTL